MSRVTHAIAISAVLLTPASTTAQDAGDDPNMQGTAFHAVLIGVQSYESDDIENLKTPVKDVEALGKILGDTYGFDDLNIETLIDEQASRDGILTALFNLRDAVRAEDNVLVYFAGHGVYDKDQDEAFWVPWDATSRQPGPSSQFVSASEVLRHLVGLRCRHILIVSDSCYSGGFLIQKSQRGEFMNEFSDKLNEMHEEPSFEILTSGGIEPVADTGPGFEHSKFAQHFLYQLRRYPYRYLTSRDLYIETERMMRRDRSIRQFPQYQHMISGRWTLGQFLLRQADGQEIEGPSAVRRDDEVARGFRLPAWVERGRPDASDADETTYFYAKSDPTTPMVLVVPPDDYKPPGYSKPMAPFLIDLDEVSVASYRVHAAALHSETYPSYWNVDGYSVDKQPIVGVTLQEAQGYAAALGKQLPDYQQWAVAATFDPGANKTLTFPWGEQRCSSGDMPYERVPPISGACDTDTAPCGARDMAGNVREWCELPPVDYRSGRVGAICGGSQNGDRENWPPSASFAMKPKIRVQGRRSSRDIGFRCIVPLIAR